MEYAKSEKPEEAKLVEEWEYKCDVFDKMLILKCFRPEKVMFAISNYVLHFMGKIHFLIIFSNRLILSRSTSNNYGHSSCRFW